VIALLTAASRVLGLVRECAYSFFFGITPEMSAFRVAFMIPNLARNLFGEGAISSAFIPVFTDVIHRSGQERARRLAGTTFLALGSLLVLLTMLAEAGVWVAHALHPSVTLRLTMITLPYMVFICLTAFAGGMLNSLHRFAAAAAAPMILNVVIIVATYGGYRLTGRESIDLLYIVSISVVVAGVGQLGSQIVAMNRAKFLPVLNLQWRDPDLGRTVALMVPMLVGMSATQVYQLADQLIAYFFVKGGRGPAVLGYAYMLYHLPVAVFGTALATAIFPMLSTKAAQGDRAGLAGVLERGLRLSVFVGLPATVGLVLVARPLVAVLYERGRFDAAATSHVAPTLIAYAIGLACYTSLQIILRAYYALQDPRTPVRVGLVALVINLGIDLLLVFRFEEAGLGLATTVATTVQAGWLLRGLARRLPELRWRPVAAGFVRTAAAGGVMGTLVWLSLRADLLRERGEFMQLAVAVAVGVGGFAAAAKLFGCSELGELLGRSKRASTLPASEQR